jgi:hypothetical protein
MQEKLLHVDDPDESSVPTPNMASPCCAWAKLARKKNPQRAVSSVVFLKMTSKKFTN